MDRLRERRGQRKERIRRIREKAAKRREQRESYTLLDEELLSSEERPGPGDYKRPLRHDGRDRYYLIHVPPYHNGKRRLPLVLSIHGGGGNPYNQVDMTGFDSLADRHGFIVVSPAGSSRGHSMLTWNTTIDKHYASKQGFDDVGFLREVVRDASELFRVDRRRIYATGLSQGGMMSYRLACEASDMVAAVAPVAGVPPAGCRPSRPVSVMHIHGTEDNYVPYNGGVGSAQPAKKTKTDYVSVEDTLETWLDINGLDDEPSKTGRRGDARYELFGPGGDGVEFVLWTVKGGGHTWPGGPDMLKRMGPVNRDISASKLAWSFFKKHPMPKTKGR